MSMAAAQIEEIVLASLRNVNMARRADTQLAVAPDALIFAPGSPLDSLGLVALLIDIEEAFAAAGLELNLSDDRAMSQARSPFRNVATLVKYIESTQRNGM